MLHADNLCLLGDFATTLDYVLDEREELAFLYHVRLEDVAREVAEWDARQAAYYESLGY